MTAGLEADRVRRFLERVDHTPFDELFLRVLHPIADEAHHRARVDAELIALENGREQELAAAREEILRWLDRVYAEESYQATVLGLNPGSTGRVADRQALAASLVDATTAVALLDVLTEPATMLLLGGWAGLVSEDAGHA